MRVRVVALSMVVAVLVGACSGDSAEPVDTPAVPGSESVPTGSSVPGSSTVPGGSVSVESTVPVSTEGIATTVPVAPTTPSSTVEATPTTLIPPAALETDPADPANNREILPEHQPIIDAYIRAAQSAWLASTDWPLDPNNPVLLSAPMTAAQVESVRSGWRRRSEQNQVLDVSGGITMRPFVVDDGDGDPDTALVWDCQIDAMFWKDADTGVKAARDAWPNVGPPGELGGFASEMVRVDGRWLSDVGDTLEPRACD